MKHLKQYAGGLLGLWLAMPVAAGNDPSSGFRIMSNEEVATHTAIMAALQEGPRREYRDAQYAQLRQRAQQQGYTMPETPPWAVSSTDSRPQDAAPAGAEAEAAARHAEMREKMQARREALLQAAAAPVDVNPPPAAEAPAAAEPAPDTEVPPEAPAITGAAAEAPATVEAVAEAPATVESAAPAPMPAAAPPMPQAVAPAPAGIPGPYVSIPPTPPRAPQPPSAPTRPAEPRFAPPEQTVRVEPPEPPAPPAMPAAPSTVAGAMDDAAASAAAGDAPRDTEAMATYREAMRARFDEYMKERQAQQEENIRRQREQREAAMEQRRSVQPQAPAMQPYAPYPYPPAGPAYGPRYPAAYPGYRTPYWQQ